LCSKGRSFLAAVQKKNLLIVDMFNYADYSEDGFWARDLITDRAQKRRSSTDVIEFAVCNSDGLRLPARFHPSFSW
jgi:hypothetical protein